MIPHAGEVAAAASVVAALACGGSWEIAGAAMATQRRSLATVPGSSAPQRRLAAASSGGAQQRCPAAVPSGRAARASGAVPALRVRCWLGGGRRPRLLRRVPSRPPAAPRRCAAAPAGARAGKRAFEKRLGTGSGAVVLLLLLRCGRRVFGVTHVIVRPLHRHSCRELVPSSSLPRNGSEELGSA